MVFIFIAKNLPGAASQMATDWALLLEVWFMGSHLFTIALITLILFCWYMLIKTRLPVIRDQIERRKQARPGFTPPVDKKLMEYGGVSVIMACKGVHSTSMANWRSHLSSDYPGPLEFIFVVESEDDAAYRPLLDLQAESREMKGPTVQVAVASYATTTTQKNTNLLKGTTMVSPQSQYVLFADDDCHYYPSTIQRCVEELESPDKPYCVTGFSVELPEPGSGVGNYCLMLFRAITLSGFLTNRPWFVWGGCNMIRKSELTDVGQSTPITASMKQKRSLLNIWEDRGYSDDCITGAFCMGHGRAIASPYCNIFPNVLSKNRTFWDFINWYHRQMFVLDTYSFPFQKFYNQGQLFANFALGLLVSTSLTSILINFVRSSLSLLLKGATMMFGFGVLEKDPSSLLLTKAIEAAEAATSHYNFGGDLYDAVVYANHIFSIFLFGYLVLLTFALAFLLDVMVRMAVIHSRENIPGWKVELKWYKVIMAFFLTTFSCLVNPIRAFFADSVVWSKIRYYKKDGLITKVERLNPTVSTR